MYILMILITRAEPCHFLWIQNAVCSVSVWYKLVGCWLVTLADALSLFSTGNRFCYLSLTALPVDYKALGKEKKKNTPALVLPNVFFPPLASILPVLRQRHLMEHLYLESRRNGSSPLHPGKQQPQAPASVRQLRGGVRCLKATALQSPSKPLVVLFIRISIIHSRTSLLHRSGGEWPNVTGFSMDARSGATAQNKASPVSCLRYALLKWHFTQGVPLQWYKYIFFPRLKYDLNISFDVCT